MKKKLIAVLMIAVLTLSLAACQGKDDSKDTSKKEKTEDSSEKKAAPKKEQIPKLLWMRRQKPPA